MHYMRIVKVKEEIYLQTKIAGILGFGLIEKGRLLKPAFKWINYGNRLFFLPG